MDEYLIVLGKIEANLRKIDDSLGWLVMIIVFAIILRFFGVV